MSTAARPTASPARPGTSLAVQDAAIGRLPANVQEQLELRRLSNQVAGQLAEMNWGKQLDLNTRRAIADWGRQFRVDVTTEIHVLGGNIYLNAAFYLRRLGELIAAGLVEYAYADHVEDDKRLKQLGPEGEGEFSRRLRERIMHAIPDAAASSVVFRIKLRGMEKEVVGVKWCGGNTRKNDPVGEAMPVETSESRAARRAMRLLASHVPQKVAEELNTIEETAEALSGRVVEAKAQIAELDARATITPKAIAAGAADDPYSVADRQAEHRARIDAVTQPIAAQAPRGEQMDRIVALLDKADVTDEERSRLANKKVMSADAADAMIAELEKLVPPKEASDDEFKLQSEA